MQVIRSVIFIGCITARPREEAVVDGSVRSAPHDHFMQKYDELADFGRIENETDLAWATRVSRMYNPKEYTAEKTCYFSDHQRAMVCSCLLPSNMLNKNGERVEIQGSNALAQNWPEDYNCNTYMNICHHMLHYTSLFEDGQKMMEELVGGGLMTQSDLMNCVMKAMYYESRFPMMKILYMKHLIAVHAHWDLEQLTALENNDEP